MKRKRILSLLLSAAMALSLVLPATAAPVTTAAEDSAAAPAPWYADAQAFVTHVKIMNGTDNGFEPNGTVTRAMVFQTLYNKEGQPVVEGGSFADVASDSWYANAAAWAKDRGLAKGDEAGNFNGNQNASRAEVATVIARYFDGVEVESSGNFASVPDYASVPDWAKAEMEFCYDAGFMTGDASGSILPNRLLSRAELAQLCMNMLTVTGKVTAISKYGNVSTDVPKAAFDDREYNMGDILYVTAGGTCLEVPYGDAYSNVDNGAAIVLPEDLEDSEDDTIMVAINMGNFAKTYGLAEGSNISFWMCEREGYKDEYEVSKIDDLRTNVRDDYESDEVFANFRPIVMGDIAEGVLYRSSNPVNPELGRNTYADDLIKAAGVKTAINLADSEETMKAYEGYDKSYYSTIDVIALNMGVDFADEEFNAKLAEGLTFMTEHEGPYVIHCTEGKDRAGFVSALLEALMGASAEEIIDDYMLTYINYYHIEKGDAKYEHIKDKNISRTLCSIAGLEAGSDLTGVDLAKAAQDYLTNTVGLSAETVTALQNVLKGTK